MRHLPSVSGNPASELFATIINTSDPAFVANIRRLPRKEIASNIHQLFKRLGIKGVSVTTPNYSMAQSISIRLPEAPDHDYREEWQGGTHERSECPICRERYQAEQRVEFLILCAFPDLENRSDSQSDHFDYCLSVR